MSLKLFNNSLLENSVSAAWTRNEVISKNIANVDTPGYTRKDINFQEYLQAAMKKDIISGIVTDPRHIPINRGSNSEGSDSANNTSIKIINDFSANTLRSDGNNVDIDKEMAELAKNEILFNTYSSMITGHFNKLRLAIKEGR